MNRKLLLDLVNGRRRQSLEHREMNRNAVELNRIMSAAKPFQPGKIVCRKIRRNNERPGQAGPLDFYL